MSSMIENLWEYLVYSLGLGLFTLAVSDIGDEDGEAPHSVLRHSRHGCGKSE